MKPIEIKKYQCHTCGRIFENYDEALECCRINTSTEFLESIDKINVCWKKKLREKSDNQQKYIIANVLLNKIKEEERKWSDNGYKDFRINDDIKSELYETINTTIDKVLEDFIEKISSNCQSINIDDETYFITWDDVVELLYKKIKKESAVWMFIHKKKKEDEDKNE